MSNMMKSVSFSIGAPATELKGVSNKSKDVRLGSQVTGDAERTIDANLWLGRAAEHYHISPNLSDYILVPVPSVISELPNTNGDSVSTAELLRFHPELGQLAYRSWVGKPTHVEHDNRDITKAKGVIFDVFLRKLPSFAGGHVKVIKLLGFDRTKDSVLCDAILSKRVNTYSLGMYFKAYQCSICGNVVSQNSGAPCQHTRPRRKTYKQVDGRLAYRKCLNIIGFETSVVADPAYSVANSDLILDPTNM
tara:strand:- start:52250 stop:52996 length:747 start_codon:yes stop_codon:yes gene_type:complete